jgi:hypothetical protein
VAGPERSPKKRMMLRISRNTSHLWIGHTEKELVAQGIVLGDETRMKKLGLE